MQKVKKVKPKGILFIESSILPTNGGVERVSWILAESFKRNGFTICFAYYQTDYDKVPAANKIKFTIDESDIELNTKFSKMIKNCNVKYIICQNIFYTNICNLLNGLKQQYQLKVLSCLHINPGYERFRKRKITKRQAINTFIYRILFKWKLKNVYKEFYSISDRFILLSETFKKDFVKLNKIKDSSKLCFIPNPLSFKESITLDEIDRKKNQVLILSRFEEIQKNLKAALRIWKIIENSDIAKTWYLIIGGYGPDQQVILDYAKQLGLRKYKFIGKVEDAQKWYKESKIFMLTSRYEGFGMTLTEAVQNACIPFAFDSYSSVHDIIQNMSNGYIIKNNDEQTYAKRMLGLMNSNEQMRYMAFNALKSSERFCIDNVVETWTSLFDQLNDSDTK